MSEFADRPLIAGSLTGIRAFSVDRLGRLIGPQFGTVFRPGENLAQCVSQSQAVSFTTGHGMIFVSDAPHNEVPHQIGSVGCTCGYYAYFDRKANRYQMPGNVLGLIQGYGTATTGSRGFRAEKAKLLALIDERYKRDYFFGSRGAGLSRSALWVLVASFAVFLFALGQWQGALAPASAALAMIGLHLFDWKGSPRPKKSISAAIRRNYPEIPVYDSVNRALKDFPLTYPEPEPVPTPENDPMFWTRSI